MRWILALPLFAVIALAQAPPGEAWQRKQPVPASTMRGTEIRLWTTGKPQEVARTGRCSIPLPNALTKEAAQVDQKIINPVPTKAYTIPQAQVPAPACADAKR